MDSSRVLRLEFQLLLHLGEIPPGQLVVLMIAHFTVDVTNLSIQVPLHLLLPLHIFLDTIRKNVVEHYDQMIHWDMHTILVLELYP